MHSLTAFGAELCVPEIGLQYIHWGSLKMPSYIYFASNLLSLSSVERWDQHPAYKSKKHTSTHSQIGSLAKRLIIKVKAIDV